MGNSGSHDFSVNTNYQLYKYTEKTLYNNAWLKPDHDMLAMSSLTYLSITKLQDI